MTSLSIIDTLKMSKALRAQFSQDQAEAITSAISENVTETLATKTDLSILRSELGQDLLNVKIELRKDIDDLRTELRKEINDLGTELRKEINDAKIEMIKWIVGVVCFNLLATVGLMITIARLVVH